MHGIKSDPTADRILRALRAGPLTSNQIAERISMHVRYINRALTEMVENRSIRMLNTMPRTYGIRTP